MATPNCPPEVAKYLNEAYLCQMSGAYTAAMVMYRAALERVLTDQGITKGSLEKRIEMLEDPEEAPAWAKDVDPAQIDVFRDLGNRAVHPDGSLVLVADDRLVRDAQVAFLELLEAIYEFPQRRKERTERMQSALVARDPLEQDVALGTRLAEHARGSKGTSFDGGARGAE